MAFAACLVEGDYALEVGRDVAAHVCGVLVGWEIGGEWEVEDVLKPCMMAVEGLFRLYTLDL